MTTAREMPRYQSHKKVQALKIEKVAISAADGSATIHPSDPEFAPFPAQAGWSQRYQGGDDDLGYYVVYDDGYASWSPSKAFEEGYTRL